MAKANRNSSASRKPVGKHPDQKLLTLCQQWQRLHREFLKAERIEEKLEARTTPQIPAALRPSQRRKLGLHDDGRPYITPKTIERRISELTVKVKQGVTILEDTRNDHGVGRLVMAMEWEEGAFKQSDTAVADLRALLAVAKAYEERLAAAEEAHRETPQRQRWYQLLCETGNIAGKKIAKTKAVTAEGVSAKIGVLKDLCPDLQPIDDWPETDLLASIVVDTERVLQKR